MQRCMQPPSQLLHSHRMASVCRTWPRTTLGKRLCPSQAQQQRAARCACLHRRPCQAVRRPLLWAPATAYATSLEPTRSRTGHTSRATRTGSQAAHPPRCHLRSALASQARVPASQRRCHWWLPMASRPPLRQHRRRHRSLAAVTMPDRPARQPMAQRAAETSRRGRAHLVPAHLPRPHCLRTQPPPRQRPCRRQTGRRAVERGRRARASFMSWRQARHTGRQARRPMCPLPAHRWHRSRPAMRRPCLLYTSPSPRD